ncbi:DUF3179 domain-containing protein [Candidatus Pacearchaeota archaeon]|nr:DUF3179 domain-containing protein [Candidatus Pacearchaeota archaeon]
MKNFHIVIIVLAIIVIVLVFTFVNFREASNGEIIEQSTLAKVSELDVPEEEIVPGGPPRDGIPPIDAPEFIMSENINFLDDESLGILVKVNDDLRFYPYNILNWHEIVNDEIGGKPLSITYCPLCATGIVFEREIAGKVYDFGTSGMLYQSNLVMYDRQTDSLWSQVLGGAIKGPLKGTYLQIYPSSIIEFGEAKKLYPDMKVLSAETGYSRNYQINPYSGYETSDDIWFGVEYDDRRLEPKEIIYTISVDGVFKAYYVLNGHELEITINEDKEIVVFDKTANKRVHGFVAFWFSWITHHENAEVWLG